MLPEYPSFKPLRAEDHALLARHFAEIRHPICDLNFANLCIWRDCETPSFCFIHSNLCILIEHHQEPHYFLEPLGQNRILDTVKICLNHTGRISRATDSFLKSLPPNIFNVSPQRDHFDYLYHVFALAELKGKKHDGKRNQIKKFIRNHPNYRFLPLEPAHADQAIALFVRWSMEKENGNGSAEEDSLPPANVICQRHALEKAFADFQRLHLQGGAVFLDGEMQGFILGSESTSGTIVVHFLYANSQMRGIYQLLIQEACRGFISTYEYINLEEDLGLPALRRTKLSYDPLRMEKKYLITLS